MIRPRAVIFDLDGTLHHREPSIERFAAQLHEHHVISESRAAFIETVLQWDNQGRGRTTEGLFNRIVRKFRLDADGDEIADDFRRTAWLSPTLFPHALDCLVALKAKGCSLGLITNGAGATQRLKLEASDLVDRFDAISISGELGIKKPDPAIFERTMNELGVDPVRTIMVGDHPAQDIAAAKELGLRTIWTPRGCWDAEEIYAADAEVRDLAAIPAIASLWLD